MKKTLITFTLFIATVGVYAQGKSSTESRRVKAGFGLTVVQTQAEFPGGPDSLQSFLSNHLVYPDHARLNKVAGRVYISFNVSYEGMIKDAKVISGVNPELDNEALRVVKLMPNWKPGTAAGNPVKVQYILPIDFIIPGLPTN